MEKQEGSKACTTCQRVLALSEFHKNSTSKDGRMSTCRDCRKVSSRTYYESNQEVVKQRARKYYEENREHALEKVKERARQNREQRNLYYKRRYEQKRNEILQSRKLYYAANREKAIEGGRRRYRINRDRYLQTSKIWKANNLDAVRAIGRRYQRRKYSAVGSHTRGEWLALVEKYDYRCLCCGNHFPLEKLARDHIVPLSKGGNSYIDNIQPLCAPCNSGKKDKEIDYRSTEWMNG